jgi:vacuolar protein sorting-associated protein 13A/C
MRAQMKPLEGAESGGAGGFFKGVGKGLVGAFTKPVVGVFDLASNVTEGECNECTVWCAGAHPCKGIRNTTTVFDNPARDRVRLVSWILVHGVYQLTL